MAQQIDVAPKSTTCFNSLLIPHSQELNIFEILQGGCIFVATWIRFQIVRANWHSKKRCLIISYLWQKQYFTLSCQLLFAKLSFVSITSLRKYQRKILIFKGTFNFHIILFILGTFAWIGAR
jgi:hypothetical protein